MAQFEKIGAEAVLKGYDEFHRNLQAMDTEMGKAGVSAEGMARQLNIAGKQAGKASPAMSQLGTSIKSVVMGAAAALSMRALIQFLGASMQAASLLDKEMQNVEFSAAAANREFGASVGTLESWRATVERTSDQFKIFSQRDIAGATTRLIDMTKRLGFSEAQMQTLLARTIDLSAGKVDLSGGIERVSAAMRGEAESAEYLGLSLNENSVKAYAESLGVVWSQLSDVEKAQQRYALFLVQTAEMEGRAGTQAEVHAGQVEMLATNTEDYKIGLGGMLVAMDEGIGITAHLSRSMGEAATNAKDAAAGWQKFFDALQGLRDLPEHNRQLAEQGIAAAVTTGKVEDLAEAIEDAPKNWDAIRRSLIANTDTLEEYRAKVQEVSDLTGGKYGPALLITAEYYAEVSEEAYKAAVEVDAFGTSTADLYDLHAREGAKVPEFTRDIQATGAAVRTVVGRYEAYGIELTDVETKLKENKEAEDKLKKAIEEHDKAVQDIHTTYADYILDMQKVSGDAGQSEQDAAASSAKITGDAAVDRKEAEAQLTEDLAQLEVERQAKLEWVRSGAADRTPEQEAIEEEWNMAPFIAQEQAIRDNYTAQVAAINEGESQKSAAISAANQQAQARAQEQMEQLKLTASLGVLESIGMLEGLTGGAASTAANAAALIKSGIIPVTEELAAALIAADEGINQQVADSAVTQEENTQFISDLAGEAATFGADQQTVYDQVMQAQQDLMGTSDETAASQEDLSQRGSDALATLDESINTTHNAIANIVSEAPTVEKQFTDMVDNMEEALTDKDWEKLGKEGIVGGIIKGIENGESNAEGAMRDLVLAMLEAAKVAAGVASPAKLFIPLGVSMAEGVLMGINSLAAFDVENTWNEFVRQNLADAFTALNDAGIISGKNITPNEWLDFVDDMGYKEYWEQAWNELAPTLSLDTTMGDVYAQVLERAGELAGDQWSNSFQVANNAMQEIIQSQIAGIADMTLAQYTGLEDERLNTMVSTASDLYGIGKAASTRWSTVGAGEAWQRLRDLERERSLRQDTSEIDAQIALERSKIADTEASILAMEKARQDMQYLESQMDLLNLMREYNLDASILGGVQLGLGADPGAIIQATTMAMQAIVEQMSASLTASTAGAASVVSSQAVSAPATPVTNTAAFGPVYIQSGMDLATLQGYFEQWSAGMLPS